MPFPLFAHLIFAQKSTKTSIHSVHSLELLCLLGGENVSEILCTAQRIMHENSLISSSIISSFGQQTIEKLVFLSDPGIPGV